MDILRRLKNNLIISLQAAEGEPLYNENCIIAMARTIVTLGGVKALRLAGKRDIKNIKTIFPDITVIGITKPKRLPDNYKELVYITPALQDCIDVIEAGADIVALDGTKRPRPNDEKLQDLIKYIKSQGKIAMADVATFDDAKYAYECGAQIISTTLSGYTQETMNNPNKPNFRLVNNIKENLDVFAILEGKVWEKRDVIKAFEFGADSVVVGSAVTRPQLITKRFLSAIEEMK